MLAISELVAKVKAVDSDLIAGLDDKEIEKLRDAWNVRDLPGAYLEFLRLMGRSAGRILRGTDAFFPRILDLSRATSDFFAENSEGMQLPDGAFVFALHQGYQVYWLESLNMPDPPVALYMEEELAPMATWQSFTEFINAEYLEAYPSGC